jgi:hypothetical protein
VAFDGNLVDGFLIGTATQPCWSGTAYGAYSVGVTPLVPVVNGEHSISGVPSTLTTGEDPWSTPVVPPLAEGASLVVVYSDPSLSPGVVYINDGAVFFFGTQDFVHSVSPPLTGSSRKFSTLGADGQVGFSTFGNPGLSGEKTFIGPSLAALTQIAGPGATQDVDSDWNGTDGQPLNQLWDTHSHSFSGILPAGATSYAVRYVSNGDCMDWTAHVLTAR